MKLYESVDFSAIEQGASFVALAWPYEKNRDVLI